APARDAALAHADDSIRAMAIAGNFVFMAFSCKDVRVLRYASAVPMPERAAPAEHRMQDQAVRLLARKSWDRSRTAGRTPAYVRSGAGPAASMRRRVRRAEQVGHRQCVAVEPRRLLGLAGESRSVPPRLADQPVAGMRAVLAERGTHLLA